MTFLMNDKVVFITGCSRKKGIGRALAEEALERGAKKVYVTARDIEHLDDFVAKSPDKIIPVQLDITNLEQVKAACEKGSDTDVLINNAGRVIPNQCTHNFNEDSARAEMEVNFFAPMRLISMFANHITAKPEGAIVNVVSIAGLYPNPSNVTYSASKAAFFSLTKALRIEMKMHGKSTPVFGVYPGPIETDMACKLDVEKGSAAVVAKRVFNGMEGGILDITTDKLSDQLRPFLFNDPNAINALKKAFNKE